MTERKLKTVTRTQGNNTANPNSFSSYAALNPTGKTLTLMVINKSPKAKSLVLIFINVIWLVGFPSGS
jgi:hypothetical protein